MGSVSLLFGTEFLLRPRNVDIKRFFLAPDIESDGEASASFVPSAASSLFSPLLLGPEDSRN